MIKPGKLFIVSAPSGAGKTSVVTRVLEFLSSYGVGRAITYTTRQPRSGEVDGVDYNFIPEAEFKKKLNEGFFVEYSAVYGYYYGTPRWYIEDLASGRSWILIIDRLGALQISREFFSAVLIWLSVESLETLRTRLVLRNGQSDQEIERRLKLAEYEIFEERRASFYTYHIINEVFKETIVKFLAIVLDELLIENQGEITKKIKSQTFEI